MSTVQPIFALLIACKEKEDDSKLATEFLEAFEQLAFEQIEEFQKNIKEYDFEGLKFALNDSSMLNMFARGAASENSTLLLLHRVTKYHIRSEKKRLEIYEKIIDKDMGGMFLTLAIFSIQYGNFRISIRSKSSHKSSDPLENLRNIFQASLEAINDDAINPGLTPFIVDSAVGGIYGDFIAGEFEKALTSEINIGKIGKIANLWATLMPQSGRRKLRELYLASDKSSLSKENAKTALILLGESHLLAVVENVEGDYIMSGDKNSITLGDSNIVYGNVVAANLIEESFNQANSAQIASDLRDLLKELAIAVGKISENVSEASAEEAARDLKFLTAEAISKSPRKKYWQVSVDGLIKAAENVGEIGKPVLDLVAKIIPILTAMSK